MVFHGEFVTLSEVFLNVRYLISILASLNCGKAQVSLLEDIATKIVETYNSKSKSYHMLSVSTLLKTMLYRSLEELEQEFTEYFERPSEAEKSVALSSSENGDKTSDSFRDFCKRINKALSSRNAGKKAVQNSLQSQATNFSGPKRCKNVTVLRISFAMSTCQERRYFMDWRKFMEL